MQVPEQQSGPDEHVALVYRQLLVTGHPQLGKRFGTMLPGPDAGVTLVTLQPRTVPTSSAPAVPVEWKLL